MIIELPRNQLELVAKSSMTELKHELDATDVPDWQRVARYARSLSEVANELAEVSDERA